MSSSFSYVERINDNIVCCICRAPFLDPYTTRTCSHTFCRECIVTALGISQVCPIDRTPLDLDDLVVADPVIRNLADELVVECPNHSLGCDYTCQRQLLDVHLRDSCEFVEVSCSDDESSDTRAPKRELKMRKKASTCDDCGAELKRLDVTSHKVSCKGTSVCSACLEEVRHIDLPGHESSCPDVVIPCTHASNGCPWKGRRNTLSGSHLPQCPYESMKGFFALNDERFSSLSQENVLLRQKVGALEGMINVMKRELLNIQHILGPWYRPQSRGAHIMADSGTERRTPLDDTTSDFQASDQSNPTPNGPVEGMATGNAISDTTEDLSSYFPPPDIAQDLYRQMEHLSLDSNPSHFSNSRSPIHQQRPSYSHIPLPYSHQLPIQGSLSSSQQSTPIITSPIAPLNLSTTLEGSLSGLRESIVGLSTSLESLSRQHEIALTTESMRTVEEIRSLKAVVHGLRMQVHAMMMERNSQVTGRPFQVVDGPSPGPLGMNMGMNEGGPPPPPWPPMNYPRFPGPNASNPGPVTKL
ncbi:hypothetical protein ABKN59_007895 [Abortiporus biennis]